MLSALTQRLDGLPPRQKGLLYSIVGVLILTPDTYLLLVAETDHWTKLFWRGLFQGAAMVGLALYLTQKKPSTAILETLRYGWAVALLLGASAICFVYALSYTSAANTLIIIASMPVLAAVLGIFVLKSNPSPLTWVCILAAIIGILIVVWGDIGLGVIQGNFAAFLAALSLAAAFVALSARPQIDAILATGLGALFSGLIGLLASESVMNIAAVDFWVLALNGGVVIPLAFSLITVGPRYISPAEVSLIMLLETVIGPIWVWILLAESPTSQAIIGGLIVVVAVAVNAFPGFTALGNSPSKDQ